MVRDSRLQKRGGDMSDLSWLSDTQMAKFEPFFPNSHGKPRVDDKRVLSGIIFINRMVYNGVMRPQSMGRTRPYAADGSDVAKKVPSPECFWSMPNRAAGLIR